MNGLTSIAPPEREPLTLDEIRAHLRTDHHEEDALLAANLHAAREACEAYTGLALITQHWTFAPTDITGASITLPLPPLQSVEAVRIITMDGNVTVLAAQTYQVDTAARPGRIILRGSAHAPLAGNRPGPGRRLEIDFTAGFGDDWNSVPQALRQGMLTLIGHYYERRTAVDELAIRTPALPAIVEALWRPFRRLRV